MFAGMLILFGCADAPPQSGTQTAAPSPGESAELLVLNVSGPTLFASNLNVTDNGVLVASLPRLTYRSRLIAPGAHEFRFKEFPGGSRFAKLEAERGKTYFLVVGYSPGRSTAFPFGGDPMTIRIVTEEEARPLMKDMMPE
jgi:hypothetical protein